MSSVLMNNNTPVAVFANHDLARMVAADLNDDVKARKADGRGWYWASSELPDVIWPPDAIKFRTEEMAREDTRRY